MTTTDELATGTLAFEQRHNSSYRYSKLKGKTPHEGACSKQTTLRFPQSRRQAPPSLKKPETGSLPSGSSYPQRSKDSIFSANCFPVPPELKLEYVVATIDVKEQKLKALSGQNPGR
jgi:putative transposase